MNSTGIQDKEPIYSILPDGDFVIENYNYANTFSSFFPGIAGLEGVPLWAFYVNRGQCIASFGVRDKDGAIQEFFPANKSYQNTSRLGFRTFIKFKRESGFIYYEPFRNTLLNKGFALFNKMTIRAHELEIEEINKTLGISVRVVYYTLSGENIPGLVRQVFVRNLNPHRPLSLEILDGMPVILPYGMNQYVVKNMTRTAEAWMLAKHINSKVGYYRVKVELDDRPEVVEIKGGNFFYSYFSSSASGYDGLLPLISDPEQIFSENTDFSFPAEFLADLNFIYPKNQAMQNRLPCAFVLCKKQVPPSGEISFSTIIGNSPREKYAQSLAEKASCNFFMEKRLHNKKIIDDLVADVDCASSFKEFDFYTKQSYLDNILRGGYPALIGKDKKHIFYVYARKHGDLERDYNNFKLRPTFYSQGNGNYRDINQNRRLDVFFRPEVGRSNISLFLNLIQLDGYNPLHINGVSFIVSCGRDKLTKALRPFFGEKTLPKVCEFLLSGQFDLGGLFAFLLQSSIKVRENKQNFLSALLSLCRRSEDASHGEGFWTDHWSYNQDLIDMFLKIYPDKEEDLFFSDKSYSFYDNDHYVAKRNEKYVLTDAGPRQFGSVRFSKEKRQVIESRGAEKNKVRVNYGKGEIYRTNLFVKLFSLALVKFLNLDPDGIGIEMEADKPNWYDSLNGLPGLFGSSVSEAIELLRLVRKLVSVVERHKHLSCISVPEEIAELSEQILRIAGEKEPFEFWKKAGDIKENFRSKVFYGISGLEKEFDFNYVLGILKQLEERLSSAVEKSRNQNGLIDTYFYYEAVKYKKTGKKNEKGLPLIEVAKFKRKTLPLFLEGQMHYLRVCTKKQAQSLYSAVKKSPLFDRALSMYKVCASLRFMPKEIGRSVVFAPGWLENESIWLHMEYKYLLELLRHNIGRQFFTDLLKCGVCFMDPQVYGRSILENSSFIVSSAFPRKKMWGKGFVARLTGSTIEWINIWLYMCAGDKLFFIEDGELSFRFSPKIPEWLFLSEKRRFGKDMLPVNSFGFTFMGKTKVVYFNPERYNCYVNNVGVVEMDLVFNNGEKQKVSGGVLKGDLAEKLRGGYIKKITALIGKVE